MDQVEPEDCEVTDEYIQELYDNMRAFIEEYDRVYGENAE